METNNSVPSNIYRCTKYCNNCPFKDNGKKIHLHPDRLQNIIDELLADDNNSFNCHKTVYNLDNDMEPTEPQKLKMCYGAFITKVKHNSLNLQMRLALLYGLDPELDKLLKQQEILWELKH